MTSTTSNQVNLANYDMELFIDKSGSMDETDCPGGKTRWQWAQEETKTVARAMSKYDSDGIAVNVFAGTLKTYENVTENKVDQIWKENSPGGSTDTATALRTRLEAYRNRYKNDPTNTKPIIFAVVTDGEPTDRKAVRDVIIQHTKWMKDHNLDDLSTGISFLQVGKDISATAFLQELDEKLEGEGAKFDIVSTKTFDQLENLSIEEVLVEALTN
jgi:uncharacterized protein YegL